MKYKIAETKNGMDIQVEDLEGKKKEILTALQECQEGRCSCPTDEYEKLNALDIAESGDGLQLHLRSKEGTKLDKEEVERCLHYTQEQLEGKK